MLLAVGKNDNWKNNRCAVTDQYSKISTEALDLAILEWMQELSPHGICITDNELRIQWWNSWLENASGLARPEVVGRNLFEVMPDLPQRRVGAYFESALNGEISILSTVLHNYLFRFASPSGGPSTPYMLQTARVGPLIQGGQIVGTIATIEDVTQREYQNLLLRKQTERQELFSWALAHLLRSTNPDEMVKQIFPRVSGQMDVDTYFNYMFDEAGSSLQLHSAGGIPPAVKQRISRRKAGEFPCETAVAEQNVFVLSNIQDTKDPRATTAKRLGLQAYVCHPLKAEDKILGTLAFGSRTRTAFDAEEIEFTGVLAQYVAIALERARNLSALNKAQLELSRHAESLEGKVQERTAKLQESINELETFSYSLAHDIRAPLRHIFGYAQLLLEDAAPRLPEESRRFVDSIIRSIVKLDSLTKDMLAYTQVSREQVSMSAVDVVDVVTNVVARNPRLSEPGVVEVHPIPKVLGERVLIDQTLSNLLDNALKFVPPETMPKIIVRAESQSETSPASQPQKMVHIWVEDNGIGIAPEYHEKIFNIFERLNMNHQGTGIGLAIVAKAVAKMGGRVGVQSEVGKGSRFWIELRQAE